MNLHHFSFPTAITFGAGARHAAPAAMKANGVRTVLVVSDRGVAALPVFAEFLREVADEGLAVAAYTQVGGNPTTDHVREGVVAWRAQDADGIIGFGGGAALDVAKAIALMAHHPGELFDYEDGRADARSISGQLPFWIALPTTAGTGSEVGRSAVISDPVSHVKRIIFSPRLLAREVFADPELTYPLPPALTAATGMDAVTHCVESFLARDWHPICDGIAIEGLRLAANSLTRCYHDGTDAQARSEMLLCSLMGAISFQKGLGVTHSCAHALSAVTNMHHGLANAVMIDHALRHNLAGVPQRFKRLAEAVAIGSDGEAFMSWLRGIKATLAIPATLTAAGVSNSLMEPLLDAAISDSCHHSNPVPCSREDFRTIFQRAFAAP